MHVRSLKQENNNPPPLNPLPQGEGISTAAATLFSTAAYAQMPEVSPVSLGIGNRQVVWIVMQTHLLFAAFILGAPIFVVICEYIGMRSKDERDDRLC